MTPETLPIDRRFKGVGRINRKSGTTNPAVRRQIERMLTALMDDGRLDILRAIRDGHVTFLQVLDAYRRRTLQELPIGDTMPEFASAMKRWIESLTDADASPKHRGSLETSRRYLEKVDPKARIADLPRVLEQLRDELGAKHPRSFNLARAAVLAYVRATLKKSHPLWLACAAVEPRKGKKAAPKAPLMPDDARTKFPHPETDKVDAIAWSMVTTGMGSKELWGPWRTLSDRIHVAGTKRGGRVRDIPLVQAPAVPRLSRDRFEKVFRKRFASTLTPYDLRRTYARWMELAGIPRTRRKLYMGHGERDVTDLYERHEIAAFLVEDAKKLRAFLGLPEQAEPSLKVAK